MVQLLLTPGIGKAREGHELTRAATPASAPFAENKSSSLAGICVIPRSAARSSLALLFACLALTPAFASQKKDTSSAPPDLLLEGGRKLAYERSFSSQREVKPHRGFFHRLVDFVAGDPDFHSLIRPYSVATDSRGRIIVTDPGASGVHIFDFAAQKYKFLFRADKRKDPMLQPQCVAVDAQDNLYVTDSESGKIFVFDANGKFLRVLGSLKGGEGFFKRPTGIAVDSIAQRIYVTDTLRNKIFLLDLQGAVLQEIGKPGNADGQFNFPTELRLIDNKFPNPIANRDAPTQAPRSLLVVDAMNFRVQLLDPSGAFRLSIGQLGDSTGEMFRPKVVAADSEGDLYVVDGLWGLVQVFNRQGQLLYYFGQSGSAPGQFQHPTGLFIDSNDRIYIVDSFNRRIQVFHYFALPKRASETRPLGSLESFDRESSALQSRVSPLPTPQGTD